MYFIFWNLFFKQKRFVSRARRVKKVLGGGWRQAGVLAAAGLVAIDTMIDRLKVDHEHAYKIAKGKYLNLT